MRYNIETLSVTKIAKYCALRLRKAEKTQKYSLYQKDETKNKKLTENKNNVSRFTLDIFANEKKAGERD